MKVSAQLFFPSAALLLVAAYVTITDGAAISEANLNDVALKKEVMFLAKLLAPLKELARESGELASLVERAANDGDFAMDIMSKRQGAWDMDYGWGGGRFGKRGSGTSVSGKRYDSFGIAGRFGRSVENVDKNNVH